MPDRTPAQQGEVVVVYALPDEQFLVTVGYESGLTATEAVRRSGLIEAFPEIRSGPLVLGVFGQSIDADQAIAPGDRVEICRALKRDPRELRRVMTSHGMVVGQRDLDDD